MGPGGTVCGVAALLVVLAPVGAGAALAQAAPVAADTTILLPQEIGTVRPGQTVRGQLEPGDWTMADGTFADIWYLQGQAGQRIVITLRSSQFDSYLQLLDAAGAKLAEDDDSGGGGRAARITFTLRASERYQIVVNSFGDDIRPGQYTLEVR